MFHWVKFLSVSRVGSFLESVERIHFFAFFSIKWLLVLAQGSFLRLQSLQGRMSLNVPTQAHLPLTLIIIPSYPILEVFPFLGTYVISCTYLDNLV